MEPGKGLNVIVGLNAQGKSAILESIYTLATSKSQRTSKDQDLIRIGQETSMISVAVEKTVTNPVRVDIILSRGAKKIARINKVKHERIGDLVGNLNAVIFSSADIDMVRGEPSQRRRFLNLEISQVSAQYVHSLGRYKRVLEQRNNLLKEIKQSQGRPDALPAWDKQLATYGAIMSIRRSAFAGSLSLAAGRIYDSLTSSSETLTLSYKSSPEMDFSMSPHDIEEDFYQKLSKRHEYDIYRGSTSIGPHRDDLVVLINGLSSRDFASQGQQRSAALAVKMAEIELMEESTGESPVVLLDDVMAELDEMRRARILEMTKDRCQTFITTTHLSEMESAMLDTATVFEVSAGKVERK